jgi:hypothetical protein
MPAIRPPLPGEPDKALLSIYEFGIRVGRGPDWVRQRMRQGAIHFVQVGGARRIPHVEYERIVREGIA